MYHFVVVHTHVTRNYVEHLGRENIFICCVSTWQEKEATRFISLMMKPEFQVRMLEVIGSVNLIFVTSLLHV